MVVTFLLGLCAVRSRQFRTPQRYVTTRYYRPTRRRTMTTVPRPIEMGVILSKLCVVATTTTKIQIRLFIKYMYNHVRASSPAHHNKPKMYFPSNHGTCSRANDSLWSRFSLGFTTLFLLLLLLLQVPKEVIVLTKLLSNVTKEATDTTRRRLT